MSESSVLESSIVYCEGSQLPIAPGESIFIGQQTEESTDVKEESDADGSLLEISFEDEPAASLLPKTSTETAKKPCQPEQTQVGDSRLEPFFGGSSIVVRNTPARRRISSGRVFHNGSYQRNRHGEVDGGS